MVGKNYIDDYFSPDRRLIQGDQHGRAFSESFNSRFPTSSEDLGGLAFAQPAAFYGQTNIQNTDGNGLWRTLNQGGNKLAFNIPSFYDYNGRPITDGTRRYLLDQVTGEIDPHEVTVALPTRYEEFRVLAGVAPSGDAGEPGEILPQTTIYGYVDLEECGYPNYSINDVQAQSTGLADTLWGTVVQGYQLKPHFIVGEVLQDEFYSYGEGSSESRYSRRIHYEGSTYYGDLYGWAYSREENVNAEWMQRTGKIRTGTGYIDLYAALLLTTTNITIDYGDLVAVGYAGEYRSTWQESAVFRIRYQDVDVSIPLGEFTQTQADSAQEFSGVNIYPLSINIFDADVEGIGGSPTVTFCYQEWTDAPETDAVVYVVTSYPFSTQYVYRKKNENESNGRRYLEFEEDGEIRRFYIGDDSELVLTQIGGKNGNA